MAGCPPTSPLIMCPRGELSRQHVLQYIPRNMHTVFALLCFVMVIHRLIFPYPSGLLRWHCGNLTIAPVPAKQPWWIWINTSCEFITNDCITTTKQSTTKPCAYFLGYTVSTVGELNIWALMTYISEFQISANYKYHKIKRINIRNSSFQHQNVLSIFISKYKKAYASHMSHHVVGFF